ncbi:MAG: DUF465 domain-containing protein [Alphaproteobacteria bacterium]|nr:DUF465 domain-containing protein [Alphaproteobacteria bacterium]
MSHTPHELHDEFPDQAGSIHALKTTNRHFERLAEEYHAVNREIHRIEAGLVGVDGYHAEELKKRRLKLKDEIAGMLAGHKAA